eukprot:CAMPEP_0171111024 /NCGR_PEP_ID=MMETSP0766_2-20121228/73469_1 /TAXON_ID=439317 /ORGANISM="Gambierdiscus australes, Strain CAWD 149" /LENGTH=130 /DNA_ID=CAMNT_0011572959 /DNA_START=1 /DNA_END=391 /DNA_ORIENTATION=+
MIVSPEFSVQLPGLGLQPFKLLIHAAASCRDQGSLSFRTTMGSGRVELKCGALLPLDLADVCVEFGVGSGEQTLPRRAPVRHNFFHQTCCGLRKGGEEWSFKAAVNSATKRLVVRAEVTWQAPPEALALR